MKTRPKTKKEYRALNVNINKDLYLKINDISLKSGITKTAITEKALKKFIEENYNKFMEL